MFSEEAGSLSKNTRGARSVTLKDYGLIMLLTLAVYLPFLGVPGFDGNEPIRLIVAKQMVKTGDWAIPMLHGKPYFLKPPLMSWFIAASGAIFGVFNEWTARLPSVIAMMLTSLLVYSLTKDSLTRTGRLCAALATLTSIGLITKGRTAEIDSLFVFFVTCTLLIWIKGYLREWKPVVLWTLSLSLAAIGFLTKGPQIIAYFYSTVFLYLLLRKRISFFFSKSHLVGILAFPLILGVYLLMTLQTISFDDYFHMWARQIAVRAHQKHFSFIEHLLSYPLRAAFLFMPWLLFLSPALVRRELGTRLRESFRNQLLFFSLVVILANFPLYWVLPSARTRYVLPVGPFLAIIIAGVFELYLQAAKDNPSVVAFFRNFLKITARVTLFSGLAFPLAVFFLKFQFSPPIVILTASAFILGFFLHSKTTALNLSGFPVFISLATAVLFLMYAELDIQHDSRKPNYPRTIAQEINLLLPDGIDTVYEMGYDRNLWVTCYLSKEVVQLDTFRELKSLDRGKPVYFLFDTGFYGRRSEEEKRVFDQEIPWVKVYSKYHSRDHGEIVLGHLK